MQKSSKTYLVKYIILFIGICMAMLYFSPVTFAANKYTIYKCDSSGLGIPNCEEVGESDKPVDPNTANNPIMAWIVFFVNLFSVIIVAGGAVMLAIAGVQYTASRDNSQSVEASKKRIYNVIIGLLMYVFFYGFMQWLIPGGVF